ncbi:MAG: GMC oxidoreductase [Gemmatimonadales bacterium]
MNETFDAVIIGSGFGGALAAHALVEAGWSVLLLERGDWVARGPQASSVEHFVLLTPHYARDAAYQVSQGTRRSARASRALGALFCVGGASVFYGGVSFRFRESDFHPPVEIVGESGAEWPFAYEDLEPYYSEAERLLGVTGDSADDPTAPGRGAPYPAPPNPLSPKSAWLAEAARSLGLHPFPLPMAINFGHDPEQPRCVRCGRCDGWACPVSAKNDVATRVVGPLLARGLQLLTRTAAVRLVERGGAIDSVECVDLRTGSRLTVRGREVLVAAGALASPQLLLASGLDRVNPGGWTVGRFLMRHANSIVFGHLGRGFPDDGLGKDLAVLDYYGGAAELDAPRGPLGSIQSVPTPPVGVIATQVPWPLPWVAGRFLAKAAGFITIAEDQPQAANRVLVDPSATDGVGLPAVTIVHRYSRRDEAARRALQRRARAILRAAGARLFYHHPIRTFSHALGTVRMGKDERSSALDRWGRFRGVENLRLVDASAFPTSAAVNPSLTIAANALRIARELVGGREASFRLSGRPAVRPPRSA